MECVEEEKERDFGKDVERIKSVGVEIIGEEMIEPLLKNKQGDPIAYDGFEPSGRMHIAQGLIRTINTNKLTQSGIRFKFWVADWFATMNLKMGGDEKMIRKAGELMIHTWKSCGMDFSKVDFIWASEEISKRSGEYFSLMLDIATKFSVKRILKCGQIMGRKDISDEGVEQEKLDLDVIIKALKASQVFYPVMQCADIFFLGVDICSLGLDQRKVNVLALEYCDKIKRRFKPIIISHAMLMGLDGSDKMSKSNPDSAIFMDDSEAEVNRKIKQAWCKPGNIEKNPILEYFRHIVFEMEGENPIELTRTDYETKEKTVEKYGTFCELEEAFKTGHLYPTDLKDSLKSFLNKYLNPVRKYFKENKEAAKLSAEVKRHTEKVARAKK